VVRRARGPVLVALLALAAGGCAPMHHRGGAVLTWQPGDGFGGAADGFFGVGSPQVFERYGVTLGAGGEVGYDRRFGVAGSLAPEAHFFLGGAQPWAAHVMLTFGLRFAQVPRTAAGLQVALAVGLTRVLAESERHLHAATLDLRVRRSFAIGFRPDPLAAWIFGLGLFYDGFSCSECEHVRRVDATGVAGTTVPGALGGDGG
jgi:hypothetical protein